MTSAVLDAPRADSRADPARVAALVVLVGAGSLLAGALGFQYLRGLAPCELCIWQRWPHGIAVALAACALVVRGGVARALAVVAAVAVLTSGAIGLFHAGVEAHLWTGPATCSVLPDTDPVNYLRTLMRARLVRCDSPAWVFLGLSMAAWNALASGTIGAAALALAGRRK